jgi:hypothetical protein
LYFLLIFSLLGKSRLNSVYFFLPQVVINAVRQLRRLATNDACAKLFSTESGNAAAGGSCATAADRHIAEIVYQKRAEKMLGEEKAFKIYIVSELLYNIIYHNDMNLALRTCRVVELDRRIFTCVANRVISPFACMQRNSPTRLVIHHAFKRNLICL